MPFEDKGLQTRLALREIELRAEDNLQMDLLLAMENRARRPGFGGHLRLQGDAPGCLDHALQFSQYQAGVSPPNTAASPGQRRLWLRGQCRFGLDMAWSTEVVLFEDAYTSETSSTGLATRTNWSSPLPVLYDAKDWRIAVMGDFKQRERANNSGDYQAARLGVTLQGDLGFGWKSELDMLVDSEWVTQADSPSGGTREANWSLAWPLHWFGSYARVKPNIGWRWHEKLSGQASRSLHTGMRFIMDYPLSSLSLKLDYSARYDAKSSALSLKSSDTLSLSMNYELRLEEM